MRLVLQEEKDKLKLAVAPCDPLAAVVEAVAVVEELLLALAVVIELVTEVLALSSV